MCVRYRLVLRSADGHEFPFDNFPVVIGRWAGCDLVLPFGPRRLARIFLDGYLYIADLQGVIGVFADSSRISEPVRLKTGMELGFGDEATFQVEVFVDPDKSPEPVSNFVFVSHTMQKKKGHRNGKQRED